MLLVPLRGRVAPGSPCSVTLWLGSRATLSVALPGKCYVGWLLEKKQQKNKTKQEHLYSGQGPQVLIAPKCTLLTSKVVSSCFVVLQALLGIGACLGVGCKELKGLALLLPFCNEFRCRLMHSWVQQASWCSSFYVHPYLQSVCVLCQHHFFVLPSK